VQCDVSDPRGVNTAGKAIALHTCVRSGHRHECGVNTRSIDGGRRGVSDTEGSHVIR
jgi:hypothetical protein